MPRPEAYGLASPVCTGEQSMRTAILSAALVCCLTPARAADLVVYGAGSLREAVGQVAENWGAKHGIAVRTEFGPSGRMRERIERGEPVDLFTSADIGHAAKLVADGRAQVMASPAKVDPLGDYTEILFQRIGTMRPGAEALLRAKMVVLDTPPGSPPPKSGDVTADAFQDGRIGAAVVYCSGRARYAKLLPGMAMVPFPAALEVGPEYGLAVVSPRPEAMALAMALLSPNGQRVMADWGFTPVTLPTP